MFIYVSVTCNLQQHIHYTTPLTFSANHWFQGVDWSHLEPPQWHHFLPFTPSISAIPQSSEEAVAFLLQSVLDVPSVCLLPSTERYFASAYSAILRTIPWSELLFPISNWERIFHLTASYYESLLLVLPSHNQLHQLHFPTVLEQFSSMSLPTVEMFSSSLIFTTSSLTPLPGFWTPNYDSSNPW